MQKYCSTKSRRLKINKDFKKNTRGRSEDAHKINYKIRTPRVRVVGDNVESKIYPIEEAIKLAESQGLDLVEIAPQADPPVCKIVDYSKFKYDLKKKAKELKAKAQKVVVKEIRFGPNTDDHDFNFKLNHAKNFLSDGAKLKAYVHFVGRTIVFKERGEILLLKFAQGLEDYGKVEQMPKLEGKRMTLIMSPKPTNKKPKTAEPKDKEEKVKAPKESKEEKEND